MALYRTPALRPLLLIIFIAITAVSVEGQSSKPPEDTAIQSLLNEVRLLRQTLQRMNLNAYRSQIIVERIRAQNDRVTRLTRMLEDTREEMANVQVHALQLTERAKAIEAQLLDESDAKRKSQLEAEQKDYKYSIDQQRQRLERLREREARLSAELQTEQGKLTDLEGRLEAMEREIENEIERQRSADKEKGEKRQPQR